MVRPCHIHDTLIPCAGPDDDICAVHNLSHPLTGKETSHETSNP